MIYGLKENLRTLYMKINESFASQSLKKNNANPNLCNIMNNVDLLLLHFVWMT